MTAMRSGRSRFVAAWMPLTSHASRPGRRRPAAPCPKRPCPPRGTPIAPRVPRANGGARRKSIRTCREGTQAIGRRDPRPPTQRARQEWGVRSAAATAGRLQRSGQPHGRFARRPVARLCSRSVGSFGKLGVSNARGKEGLGRLLQCAHPGRAERRRCHESDMPRTRRRGGAVGEWRARRRAGRCARPKQGAVPVSGGPAGCCVRARTRRAASERLIGHWGSCRSRSGRSLHQQQASNGSQRRLRLASPGLPTRL